MKTVALPLIVLGLALAAVPMAAGQDACQSSFTLVGKADSKWYLEGGNNANPTLTACPGQEASFTIKIEGALPHDFAIQGQGVSTPALNEGDQETVTWSVPASGSFTYLCNIHGTGMSGTINAASTATSGGSGDGGNDSPGFEFALLALAGVGAALLLRRRS